MNRLDIAKIICPHAWEAETRTSERYREWALGLADQILALHQRGSDDNSEARPHDEIHRAIRGEA